MVLRFLLILLLSLSAGGCGVFDLIGSLFPEGALRSPDYSRIRGITPRAVWEHLQEAVNEEFDIRLADDENLELESDWNEHLGPMYRMGRRYQIAARVVTDELGLGVEITCRREVNTNIRKPLDSRDADWSGDGRDPSRERKILWLMNMRLRKFGPSDRILSPGKSDYLTSEEERQEEKLWSDRAGSPGRDGPPPRRPGKKYDKDIWKD
jgi:hypothetical protein